MAGLKKNDINLFKASTVVKGKGSKKSPIRYVGIAIVVILIGIIAFSAYNVLQNNKMLNEAESYTNMATNLESTMSQIQNVISEYGVVNSTINQSQAVEEYIDAVSADVFLRLNERQLAALHSLFILPDVEEEVGSPKSFYLDTYNADSLKYYSDTLYITCTDTTGTGIISSLVSDIYNIGFCTGRLTADEAITSRYIEGATDTDGYYIITVKLRTVFEYVYDVLDSVTANLANVNLNSNIPSVYFLNSFSLSIEQGTIAFVVRIPSTVNWNIYIDAFIEQGQFLIGDEYDGVSNEIVSINLATDYAIEGYTDSETSVFPFKVYNVEFKLVNAYEEYLG